VSLSVVLAECLPLLPLPGILNGNFRDPASMVVRAFIRFSKIVSFPSSPSPTPKDSTKNLPKQAINWVWENVSLIWRFGPKFVENRQRPGFIQALPGLVLNSHLLRSDKREPPLKGWLFQGFFSVLQGSRGSRAGIEGENSTYPICVLFWTNIGPYNTGDISDGIYQKPHIGYWLVNKE